MCVFGGVRLVCVCLGVLGWCVCVCIVWRGSLESMNGVHDIEIASCAIQYRLTVPVLSQTYLMFISILFSYQWPQ